MKEWDWITDGIPFKGSLNMAVDEFLIHLAAKRPRTFLRFYRWEKPTASLGFSQEAGKVLDFDSCRRLGVDIVRRITGGKLVLHHREVTYAVCSSDQEIFPPDLRHSYLMISRALMLGLKKMGLNPGLAGVPPSFYSRGNLPCFALAARDEIEVGGRKIIGSAQKRMGSRFLQHGSIPLEDSRELLKLISPPEARESPVSMTCLVEALGREVGFAWVVEMLSRGISEFFGIKLKPRTLDPGEMEVVRRIQRDRYENPEWTFSRKSGCDVDLFDSR